MSFLLSSVFFLITLWAEVYLHEYMGWSILWRETPYSFPLFMSYGFILMGAAFLGDRLADCLKEKTRRHRGRRRNES